MNDADYEALYTQKSRVEHFGPVTLHAMPIPRDRLQKSLPAETEHFGPLTLRKERK